MKKTIISMLSVAVFLFATCAAHAADDAGCTSARYKAAGKYAGCEAKAAAKAFDDQAFLKCRQKYAATWTKLGTKYPGTSCAGARFVDNGLTITDNLTQLVWEKKTTAVGSGMNASDRHDVDNLYSWSAVGQDADGTAFTDFLDDLNSTGFAGQHDWRLPTISEFHSILSIDAVPCGTAPCVVDQLVFQPTKSADHWTSATSASDPSTVWCAFFDVGNTLINLKTSLISVRAVRAGS